MSVVRLKKGREKSAQRRHPWIFSGAISDETGAEAWAEVQDAGGRTLGFGLRSPQSQIRVRMWSFGEVPADFSELLPRRLTDARARRSALLEKTDAVRYVNSEGDFLPGIILDKYGDTLVLQLLTEGADRQRDAVTAAIRAVFQEPNLYEKSTGRTEEGLPDRAGPIYGAAPESAARTRVDDRSFWVDIPRGHKTGFYLDQRKNLRRLREWLPARSHDLLDLFCYSGAFGVTMRDKFEKVTFVDLSGDALSLCERNWDSNGGPGGAEFVCQDVFRYLRQPTIGPFDAVVLDPPSFARRKNEVEGACRGYKDVQRLAMKALQPGGLLAAFCCSHHIDADLFQKVVFAAALDARRPAQVLDRFGPDQDHPVSIDHPEGEYLKGMLLRVL
ncbi:MAG: hypothetical protein A3G34_01145 [Candidatus Lindowbacteria bacterium RIFCSPLOWO2_12_FULL_62_27]|nr:MAG: hypothetical protein A3G34_01145 [Candidatus Lindowbacteria bacterium RIFCSPLOWO2_12_FULL_62_27]OGH55788.1 MAG: hypothetical protein A3I06_13270 [Candidatus Lindowbacteria bacterium RIFCSPLOWO2_02_FULL_62_12]